MRPSSPLWQHASPTWEPMSRHGLPGSVSSAHIAWWSWRKARPALQPHLEKQFGVGTPQGGLTMLHTSERICNNIQIMSSCSLFSQCVWHLAASGPHRPTGGHPGRHTGKGGGRKPGAYAAGGGGDPLGGEPLHTYDGIPQGDPLSALIFAAAMTLAITGALGDGTAVRNVSYIDDTLLMCAAEEMHMTCSQPAAAHGPGTTTHQDQGMGT